jgi:4-amino-4-deoxy-L-arabinose transferase-like glycosyltransferase
MSFAERWSGWLKFYSDHRSRFFWVGVSLIALLYIVICMLSINRQPLGFDEAWDLQASSNFAENGSYASFGSLYGGPDKVLDPHLSTGPTTMLPVALSFELFGTGVIQARVVMMAFYLLAIALIAWYAWERTKSGYAIIAPLLLLLVASQPVNFRLDVLGEMPGIACALGSLIAWHRKRFLLAGLLAGLAVLSKMIFFFLIIAGTLILVFRLVRHWKDKRPVLLDAGRWIAGGAVPLLFWEIFKFFQLGSFAAYIQNWKDYVHFFMKTGSGLADDGTRLTFGERSDLLILAYDIETWLLLGIVLSAAGLLYLRRKQLRAVAGRSLYGLTFIGLYLAWWFLMADGTYTRYVVPLAAILIAVVVAMMLQEPVAVKRLKQWPKRLYYGLATVILLVSLAGVYQYYFPLKTPAPSPSLADQQRIANHIAASRPHNLTHMGWWQNTEIAFLGDLRSKDERLRAPGETYELLLAPIQKIIVPELYEGGRSRCIETYLEELDYIYCRAHKPLDYVEKE